MRYVIPHCHTSIPLEENTTSRVTVYFYSGKWIPLVCCTLVDAIGLHRKARLSGKEFLAFPFDEDPNSYTAFLLYNSGSTTRSVA